MLPLPMQDSLPAGWLAFTGWELNPLGRNERFPRCYIFFPFPGFILTLREFIALVVGASGSRRAIRSPRAAGSDAGGRVSEHQIERVAAAFAGRVPPRPQRDRLHRRSE